MKNVLDQIAQNDKYQKELRQENVLLKLEVKAAKEEMTRLNRESINLVKKELTITNNDIDRILLTASK